MQLAQFGFRDNVARLVRVLAGIGGTLAAVGYGVVLAQASQQRYLAGRVRPVVCGVQMRR